MTVSHTHGSKGSVTLGQPGVALNAEEAGVFLYSISGECVSGLGSTAVEAW